MSIFGHIAEGIIRRPRLAAAALVVALLLSFVGMTFVGMETGMKTYVREDTERYNLLSHYTTTYQSESLMVLVEADNILDPAVIDFIDDLETEIQKERYITGTSSIAGMIRGVNGGLLPTSPGELRIALDRIPLEVRSRYVPSNTMTIFVATLEPGVSQESTFALVHTIDARIHGKEHPPGVTVTLTGEAPFSEQMSTAMGTSMSTLIMAAMVLMVIAVGIFFGHVRYRLLSVGIVATGLIFTFGIIGWSGMKISMAVIAAFPVLIGIGIDYAIQFHARFDEEARKSSVADAVRTTLTKAGPSVMYAMLATAMGFLALWISPLPMIAGFGIVCVIGIASCYLAALFIVPTFGVLFQYRPLSSASSHAGEKSMIERYDEGIGRVVGWVAHNPIPVLLILGLAAFVGFQMDNVVPINTDEKTFVPPDMPAKVQLDKVSRMMESMSGMPVLVRGDRVVSVDGIRWMDEFQRYEEEHNSKIIGSASLATWVRQYNGGVLPATDGELEQALERIPPDTRKRYMNGYSEAIMEFYYVSMTNQAGMSQVDLLRRDLDYLSPPPGVTAEVTGMSEMFTNLIREISAGKTVMTVIAFVLIFVFLFVVYWKAGKAVTPLVPIVLIVGWNGLIMYMFGIDYTPLTATLGSMSIGVASEYTILIMERAYEERANGLALIPAIQYSVQRIGTAITVSGLTTVFGFAALMLSDFGMINNFGAVTVISVGFALIGAIIAMPAILVLLGISGGPQAEGGQEALSFG
ncbi:MAG: hydrophobe/amphiphile efflux-3 (HAE3) family transporter [Methanomicrobiales archaeon]|nr:hydrophobe/amphiphile efflux-3 (HAE3) family transporter [Methanomicrobiales archaeon]